MGNMTVLPQVQYIAFPQSAGTGAAGWLTAMARVVANEPAQPALLTQPNAQLKGHAKGQFAINRAQH